LKKLAKKRGIAGLLTLKKHHKTLLKIAETNDDPIASWRDLVGTCENEGASAPPRWRVVRAGRRTFAVVGRCRLGGFPPRKGTCGSG
jgi:hypothetical protein